MSIDLTKRKEQAEVSLVKHLQASVNYPRGWCPGGGL